jgi:hypothetical protein
MKEVKILAIIFAFALLILFVRQGLNFSLLEMLPLGSDRPFDIYDFGGLGVICIVIWALLRLWGKA